MGAADTALYDAKRAGRDQVVVSDGSSPDIPSQGSYRGLPDSEVLDR